MHIWVNTSKLAGPEQSRLGKAKTSHHHDFSQYNNNAGHGSLDTVNPPDSSSPEPGAFNQLHPELKPRQADTTNTYVSTCGYLNGDANLPRTADSGFDCRVDTKNAIWGFCPTTVNAVSDCGLVGGCVDAHACAFGCGISDDSTITTFTWFVPLLTPILAILFPLRPPH